MGKKKTDRGALLTANLPQLQNLIKRDPAGYREEFMQQWNHYESIRRIFEIKPDDDDDARRFRDLVGFISQVSICYPEETAEFPSQLSTLLLESYATLNPDTRKTLVHNLVLLRNKDVITSLELLKTLFPLLPRTTSALLRSFIRKTILTDIKTANLKTKNHKLNRAVQAMLFGMVERGMDGEVIGDKGKLRGQNKAPAAGDGKISGEEAMWAITLTKELWKKGIWTDAKSVSIVALGCFHPNVKVQSAAIHFFLGSEDEEIEDSDEEAEIPNMRKLEHQRTINKKSSGKEAKMRRVQKLARKMRREKQDNPASNPNFPALQLLNDPQTFGEKLYDGLNRYDKRYSIDHKILTMQLLSRVMGSHKLCVLGFYTYIIKYLSYHQLRVTLILVSLAQSVHDLTPPDVLTPVVHKLAKEFVHPGVSAQVIAAGLNSIREVCRRQPWCMEADLLSDLVEYRKSKDKGVVTASRSLMQLFREVNPELLARRERGKSASMGIQKGAKPLPFGHAPDAAVGIEGLELLEDYMEQMRTEAGGDPDEDWGGWEEEEDSESDSGGSWIDVDSDGPDVEVSDSEDEGPKKGKKKGKGKKGEEEEEEEEKEDEDVKMAEVPARVSTMAMTELLTPAHYAMMNDLRLKQATKEAESGGGSASKRKLSALQALKKANSSTAPGTETFLSEGEILGPRKKAKADYAERMESIQKGREGREKFGSSRGKKKQETPSSSTNREKARNKPIMMILSSGTVRNKKKASLREKQQKLRAHVEKAKKMKH